MRHARARSGGAIVLAVLLGGCAGAGDSEPAAVFELTEVDGEPLPVSYPEEDGCTEELLSATLTLEEDGEWEMVQTKQETCGEAVGEDEDTTEGTFEMEGQAYTFSGPGSSAGGGSAGEIEVEALADGTLADGVLDARLQDGTTVTFRRR